MTRIGLFLDIEPHFGGIFQYGQAVLEAVSALPGDKYSIVVAYTSKSWLNHIPVNTLKAVYVPKRFWARALWRIWAELNLPIVVWRKTSPHFDPLARTLLKEKCDLWIFPEQGFLSFRTPVPALSTIHDLMHRYESRFPETSASCEYRLREFTCRNTCAWSRGILVDSEIGKTHVMESYGISENRIHVLPYIAPKYIYSQCAPDDFDSRYNLPAKFIFYPAQFWEHKNHKKLLSAVGRLKQDIPDLKLVLAGLRKNGYKSTLKHIQSLHLNDDVMILGYVPDEDIPELYRRARALVMPTFFGPTNIPPLEAFAAGCPVSISRVYGIPEQVGDAALLFDPESVDEIANCIRRLWNDDALCLELVRRGRQKTAAWGQKQFNVRLADIIGHLLS